MTSSGNTGRRKVEGAQCSRCRCAVARYARCSNAPAHPTRLRHRASPADAVREAVAQVASRRLHRRLGGDCRHDDGVAPDVATRITARRAPIDGIEINFRRDPTIYDGRFANNGWLQELPKPMTKLTWDNAALIAPATAEANELQNGDIIAIQHDGRTLNVPVWMMPGPRQGLDHGHRRLRPHPRRPHRQRHRLQHLRAARIGVAVLRRGDDDGHRRRLRPGGTQDHWSIEGRNILRSATLEEFKENPAFVKEMEHVQGRQAHLALRRQGIPRPAVGHGDRHERLHRLRRA